MVSSCVGWLFHVSIEQNKGILWIKTEDKKVLRLVDSYQPFFYILPRNEYDGICLYQLLSQQPVVKKVSWEENKSTNLFEKHKKHKLIFVTLDSAQNYTTLIKKLEKDGRVKQLFNNDLSLVQQYLFHKLKIGPTSKVKVEYSDSKVVSLTKIDDDNKIDLPPFTILYIDVQTFSGEINPEDPVIMVRTRFEGETGIQRQSTETLIEGREEKDILERFCNYVQAEDPDIIVSASDHFTDRVLDYLFTRTQKLGLNLHLGREKELAMSAPAKYPGLQWIRGRISLNNYSILNRFGLAGLIEKCRFSSLTLDVASKNGINHLIDSRNCFELIQLGFVILPKNKQSNHEHVRTLEDLVTKDKGGMIISPQTGLHENVIVLDYDSEYANLIVNHNLSYETISQKGEQIDKSQTRGLLPTVVEKFLNRRLHFKEMLNEFPEESKEYLWCQQRIDSLKHILVCLYGTSGSVWNRFGNVSVFEEINKLSREVLLKTKDIVQKLGFEVIYADTDSVFIKDSRLPVTTDRYAQVIDTLRRETALPISIEHNFKFLVLLPLEAIERIEALKQYFGITHDGELVVRGIEARRHDTPNFIKRFQTKLLYTLFDCNNVDEVVTKGYENALLLVTGAIDRIMIGGDDITQEDLVISKLLGQNIEKYKSLFPHVSAAIQLSRDDDDRLPSKGDSIKYVYTDAHHSNPLCRVTPVKNTEKEDLRYDKEKYREMILDAAQSVLGYFGFDRTVYGDKRNTTPRKWRWLQELRQQRERDIRTEMLER